MHVIRIYENGEGINNFFTSFESSLYGEVPQFTTDIEALPDLGEKEANDLLPKIREKANFPEGRDVQVISWHRLMDELFEKGTI